MTTYNVGDKVIFIGTRRCKEGAVEQVLPRGLLIRWACSHPYCNPTIVSVNRLDRMAKVCNDETFA